MLDLIKQAHSNESLKIIQLDYRYCVCKTFRKDLVRAQRNVDKQRNFQSLYTETFRVTSAEVLNFQVYPDSAELVMPYIQGMTGHMFPVYATRKSAQTLSSSLSTMLYSELSMSHEEVVSTSHFRDKLVSVSAATSDSDLKRLVDDCQDVLDTFPAEMSYPMGPCHGDLTLSNLILNSAMDITLIDFLHTYLESPLQDVAKLKQDFVYGWSFRKDSDALRLKAEILCRHHFPEAIIQIERMYPAQIFLLTLLALARIAPYVKDSISKRWLIHSLNHCLRDFSQRTT